MHVFLLLFFFSFVKIFLKSDFPAFVLYSRLRGGHRLILTFIARKNPTAIYQNTVKNLRIGTDRSEQKVLNQIRLLLKRSSLIWVYTVCHSICILLTLTAPKRKTVQVYETFTIIISGVPSFRSFTVSLIIFANCHDLLV